MEACRFAFSFAFLALLSCLCAAQPSSIAADPPIAAKKPHSRTLHGNTFVDNYFWLREKSSPEVIKHLDSENDYANAVLAPLAPAKEKIYQEMVGRIQETDLETPYFDRGWFYYSRTVKGKQYPIMCRKKGALTAKEEVMLDLNELAKGKKYLGVGASSVSPNGRYLAYSVDETGYRQYDLFIKDLTTGKLLPDRFGKVVDVVWAADNKTLFYTTENSAKRPDKLYRRAVGEARATFLLEEKTPQFNLGVGETSDHRFLVVQSESSESSECRLLDLNDPTSKMTVVRLRTPDHQYYVDHVGDWFYIRTNFRAKEYRIVKTKFGRFAPTQWSNVLPEQKNATITDFELLRGHLIARLVRDSVPQMKVLDLRANSWSEIKFPEANYSAFFGQNEDLDTTKLRLSYTSLITPRSVYDYDLKSLKWNLLKQVPVKGYDKSEYATELVWATARDGVKVPISICYKKGSGKDRPLWLYAYGSYGASSSPSFNSSRLSALDRGMIYAIAHVRGGGELGEKWHDDGKMSRKMNTFTDFVDCADYLVEEGYTSHDRMAISGGSAGGLTMGAVMNLRPDLAKVALVYVPFVDVINTMCDESLPLTTQEFLEWGNPKVRREYGWISRYSPYENIKTESYPSMLVRTSLNDSQVPYWEAAKWVARLREIQTGSNPLIMLCNMAAGHGGASGRYDSLKDTALDYAFMFKEVGLLEP